MGDVKYPTAQELAVKQLEIATAARDKAARLKVLLEKHPDFEELFDFMCSRRSAGAYGG